jgi:hypothetical protein
VREMRAQPWWSDRIRAALGSYYVYQHLGNLSPARLAESEVFQKMLSLPDGGEFLCDWAEQADLEVNGSRWSYSRHFGRIKIVVFDSREGRVLDANPRRMVDDKEWQHIVEEVTGDFDHVILADTLPMIMSPGAHHLEAWNEAICAGAWGPLVRGPGEWLRRELDMEHWPAFNHSFRQMADLLRSIGAGERGSPPATVVMLGGDVHHAYLAEVAFRRDAGVRSAVYQAVCSPFRNALARHERTVIRGTARPMVARFMRMLARSAGVPDPDIRWRLAQGPTFDNQFATLELDGRNARLRIEKILPGNWQRPGIETSLERRLS